ncbi:unnamed protein product, partial [Symbiodinium sp. CCMP2456]
VSPDFDWAESLQGAKLHISQEGEVSLEAPRCKEELGIRLSESEWSQLLCLAPPKQGLAKLKICGRVDAVLQLHRTSKILSAADSAARITQEELSRQQDAGNKAKRGQRKAEAKRRADTRSRCQLPSLSDALCGVAWDFGRELEPIYREDAWDGTGHAPEVVRRESTGSKGIPAEMLGLKLKMKVVELEAGQSLKVAFWSMGNFCLDGLESVTFTSYQLERPGAKGKTRLQLTGKASDSPGLHVLGHPAKVFPPFDDLTLIAVHLPESRELQICPCALFNIEIDRQGKGYSDPNDPVNLNREEAPVPEEDTGPMTAKQYRDKRKLAIESFGTAKKMRSFGQVAERLDRDLEVANLEQYTGSISARVEEQLKLKQTAEEKDEETKREVLPPFIRSDDPQKIYVDGLQSIVSDEALENEESLPAEGFHSGPARNETCLPMTQTTFIPGHVGPDGAAVGPKTLGASAEPPCTATEDREEEDLEHAGMIAKQPGTVEDTEPRSFWIACGVLVHLAWGTYPVFARYMQVMLHMDGLLVLIVANLVSFVVVQTVTCHGLGDKAGRKVGMMYAMLITGRGVTNMLTSKFTIALYTGIVTQFAPFIVAGVSWVALGDQLPRCILPSLIISTLGSLFVVLGQADAGVSVFSVNDGIGIGMAVVSICVSAGIRVTMKVSSSSLSGFMLNSWQYMSAVPQVLLATVLTPPAAWVETMHFSSHQLAVLGAFILVLPLAASYGQVTCVRKLGPSLDASIQPVRLLSTIAGGYLVLDEPVKTATAWLGLAIIVITLVVYLALQNKPAAAPTGSTPQASAK